MNRPIRFAMGLALFSGACAAPSSTDTQANTNTSVTPANPTPPAPIVARRTGADAFSGASALDATAAPGGGGTLPPTGTNVAPANGGAPTGNNANANAAAARPASTVEGPQMTPGANFTIFCEVFTGPDHVTASNEVRRVLLANTRLTGWYLIHSGNQSALYHGYYRQFELDNLPADATPQDRADAERAQRDKAILETIPDPRVSNRKLFPQALFVGLDAPDPTAPPEWNLANAPGYYSVQIAAYTTPDRKQAVIEAVREARASGVEAYYFHGDGISSICIGSWPESAVRLPAGAVDPTRTASDPAGDNYERVIQNNGAPLTEEQRAQLARTRGERIRVVETAAEVVDPTLLATLSQFDVHAVNGLEQTADNNPDVKRPSFIVQVPGRQPRGTLAADGTGIPSNAGSNENGARRANLQQRLQGIGR